MKPDITATIEGGSLVLRITWPAGVPQEEKDRFLNDLLDRTKALYRSITEGKDELVVGPVVEEDVE
jgi:hypothetical protein